MGDYRKVENEHQLWVNLNAVGSFNALTVFPDILKMMFTDPSLKSSSPDRILFELVLPSDIEWRTKIYLKLLEKKRAQIEAGMPARVPEEEQIVEVHYWNIKPKPRKPQVCPAEIERRTNHQQVLGPGPITWKVSDIAKAAALLGNPPFNPDFSDEQEMRRVYTLIYDVFRYKNILNQALNDALFFQIYVDLNETLPRVWLLLYDLYFRSFKKRDPAVINHAIRLFRQYGLMGAEDALWAQRVKLAAAIARIRIENNALWLNQLLPKHLRNDRLNKQSNTPLTCWVNTKKVKDMEEVNSVLEKTLDIKLIDNVKVLRPDTFKWDKHCPYFVLLDSSMRTKIAQSTLVNKNQLILQDRSFCLGPATFGKIVADLQLRGSVIQSHINSPRTTAYLAMLLSQNEQIANLLAFSAGNRKEEYEEYFNKLGVTNISLYSENLTDLPSDATCLQPVIAVFATPPNSYSAVSDPIDLVCSRGGDLGMLQVLTESEVTEEGKQRVAAILDEQRKTLRFAMSRPQIQLVLYETHSEIDEENDTMVQKTIKEINRIALQKHAVLQGKLLKPSLDLLSENDEINNNDMVSEEEEQIIEINSKQNLFDSKKSSGTIKSDPTTVKVEEVAGKPSKADIVIPDCDIFEVPDLPDLCPNSDACLKMSKEGCYLALLQRKQVTKLDNKYMIQMAEVRGIFGTTSTTSGRTKGSKSSKSKKQEQRPVSPPSKIRRRTKDVEIDRISAPTQASIRHSRQSKESLKCCPRIKPEDESAEKVPQSRRWWSETTRHIIALKASLSKQKILPSTVGTVQAKTFVNKLMRKAQRVDEIVARTGQNGKIPIFPRLRLSRPAEKVEKMPLPISVTVVEFPIHSRDSV